jgi:hypothetical protein
VGVVGLKWNKTALTRARAALDGFALQLVDQIPKDALGACRFDWRAVWAERVAPRANLERLMRDWCVDEIARCDEWLHNARERVAEVRAEHERRCEGWPAQCAARTTSADRVVWHEKSLAKLEVRRRVAERLAALVDAGLPDAIVDYLPLGDKPR